MHAAARASAARRRRRAKRCRNAARVRQRMLQRRSGAHVLPARVQQLKAYGAGGMQAGSAANAGLPRLPFAERPAVLGESSCHANPAPGKETSPTHVLAAACARASRVQMFRKNAARPSPPVGGTIAGQQPARTRRRAMFTLARRPVLPRRDSHARQPGHTAVACLIP